MTTSEQTFDVLNSFILMTSWLVKPYYYYYYGYCSYFYNNNNYYYYYYSGVIKVRAKLTRDFLVWNPLG